MKTTAAFEREYQLLKSLKIPGVPQACALMYDDNRPVLVAEDCGGLTMQEYITLNGPLNLNDFLKAARGLAEIIGQVHQNQIIHKDVNSSNVIRSADNEKVFLIDFGIATTLSRENPSINNPNILECTLAYMSPEQTGRMNRPVDKRSDLYSLGVTFYHWITGRLPFKSNDPMELAHCHIARNPSPPHELNTHIPMVVSEIIMKLMSKKVEDRYQTAFGLLADLNKCSASISEYGEIREFKIGQDDIPDEFRIPDKLYGRAGKIKTLLDAFDRICTGTSQSGEGEPLKTEIILVTGQPGIGKSAMVREIHKPIIQQRGYFISGKFEQLFHNSPYLPMVQAFSDLVRQLLGESAERIENWKIKLNASLGSNAQIAIDIIPELELIMGPQQPVQVLPGAESQNRFNQTFRNLIHTFASGENPIVLFLDDMQWADSSSLKLLEIIATDIDIQRIMVIGSYRDTEVNEEHPLMLKLNEIRKKGVFMEDIHLEPLSINDIKLLISETLHTERENVTEIARLCEYKTLGNPFFLNQFLYALYREKSITFSPEYRRWIYDIKKIRAHHITDNVIELLADKIKDLPGKVQEALKMGACIGSIFDLKTLSAVNGKTLIETSKDLLPLLSEDLLLPLDEFHKYISMDKGDFRKMDMSAANPRYKFPHDRIQQAAYSLIPEEQKPIKHLFIGRALLKNLTEKDREEHIFDLANHLNYGRKYITDPEELFMLARINMQAGLKARQSAAYEHAAIYLQEIIDYIDDVTWKRNYEFCLEAYSTQMEMLYLTGKFDEMENISKTALQRAKSLLDRVRIYEIKIQGLVSENRYNEAFQLAMPALRSLGVRFPRRIALPHVLMGLLATKVRLYGRDIENLAATLPEMTHPETLAALRILQGIVTPAYFSRPLLYPLIMFKFISLSLKFGMNPMAAVGYAAYGIVLSGMFKDMKNGVRFGKLAMAILDRFKARKNRARIIMFYSGFLKVWDTRMQNLLSEFLEAHHIALETGDYEYAAHNGFMRIFFQFYSGTELNAVEQESEQYRKVISQLNQEISLRLLNLWRQMILNFRFPSPDPLELIGPHYDERSDYDLHVKANDQIAIFSFYFLKLVLSVFYRKFPEGLDFMGSTQKYLEAGLGTPSHGNFQFYSVLACTAACREASAQRKRKLMKKARKACKALKKWSDASPLHFSNKLLLAEAEIAAEENRDIKAMELYRRAFQESHDKGLLHEKGLAAELAGEFYARRGEEKFSRLFIRDAYYAYIRWNAEGKTAAMEKCYPWLTDKQNTKDADFIQTFDPERTRNTTVIRPDYDLDIHSVVKASQALSGETALGNLLTKLIQIVIENAGAQKGFLVLPDKKHLFIEAAGSTDGKPPVVMQSIPVNSEEEAGNPVLPLSIINYVTHSHETVVLDNAATSEKYARDPYIIKNQPLSVLCIPLMDRGKLSGIVYLENNLTMNAFTPSRVQILQMLSSQAAVSLENARLNENLEALNSSYVQSAPHEIENRTLELEEANRQLQQLSIIDPLTGIGNRRKFDEFLEREWPVHIRGKRPISLLICDVDFFKQYNDHYGHPAGDECLKEVARAISSVLTRPGDMISRYGGEEFAIFLPETDVKGAYHVAEKIIKKIQSLKIKHECSSVSKYVTISIGLDGMIPAESQEVESLIQLADRALYRAKKCGRNNIKGPEDFSEGERI